MMKLWAIVLLPFSIAFSAHSATVNIIIKPKSPYQFNINAIWDFDVINLSDKKLTAKIINTVYDRSNKIIYRESSENIGIDVGFQTFGKERVPGIRKEITDPGYASVISLNHTLKAGAYNHCIELLVNTGNEAVGESACEFFEVSILSPPQLIYPENKSYVSEPYPVFLWTPLTLPYQSKITYNFKLVEILKNQTMTDAILRNSPLCYKTGLQTNMYPYPADAFPLQDYKFYAWQVEVVDEKNMVAITEIWEFTKGKDTATVTYSDQVASYLDLNMYDINEIYSAKGVLKIKFVPKQEKGMLTYKIYDKGKLIVDNDNKIPYDISNQLYEVPVMKHLELMKEHVYIIVLQSDDGRTYQVKINYNEPQIRK